MQKIVKGKKIIIVIIAVLLFSLFLSWVKADTTETTMITFTDNGLYQRIKDIVSENNFIVTSDDSTNTIEFRTQDIPQITILDLNNSGIEDLSGIEAFTKLKEIDLSNNNVLDISHLLGLNELTKLDISNNENFSNFVSILSLNGLEYLNISKTAITDITNITSLENLKELYLAENDINDLSKLYETVSVEREVYGEIQTFQEAKLINLEVLDVSDLENVSISDISIFRNLKSLYAKNDNIEELTGITKLIKLEYINLDYNKISSLEDIVKSEENTNGINSFYSERLTASKIHLKGNMISDLTYLRYLGEITELDLSENYISDITYIQDRQFEEGKLDLRNQTIEQNVYNSKDKQYQYIILPDFMQKAKDPDSILYDENASFSANGTRISINDDPKYSNLYGYSAIIECNQDDNSNIDEELEVLVNGGIISGTKVKYYLKDDEDEIDSILFDDYNINRGIYSSIQKDGKVSDYKLRTAPYIINMKHSEIANIEQLDLSDYEISSIQGIENFIGLTNLNVSNNNIESTEALSELNGIEELRISNNRITDLSDIIELSELVTLDISNNQINNINDITNLDKLENLYMDNNNIRDISFIQKYNLKRLAFSNNHVTDISILKTAGSNLLELYMNSNYIMDVSPIEDLDIEDALELNNQKIICNLNSDSEGSISILLPKIFLSSKSIDSKIYTNNDFRVENCELVSNNTFIIVDADSLNEQVATIEIDGGLADGTILQVGKFVDINVTYNPEKPEKGKVKSDVTASISFNKENVRIINNEGSNEYTFTENGYFSFEYQDENGYISNEVVMVDWIDKDGPSYEVLYSTKDLTYDEVSVLITTDEAIQEVDGWQFLNDERTEITKDYLENTDEVITIKDELGNESEVHIDIKNIKKKEIVQSETYLVDEEKMEISDISPDTKMEDLLQQIQSEVTYKVVDKEGNEIEDSENLIATGNKIVTAGGTEYSLLVKGDTNGDGKANIRDMIIINNYRLFSSHDDQVNIYLKAGDINKDNEIDVRDMIIINNYRLYNTNY